MGRKKAVTGSGTLSSVHPVVWAGLGLVLAQLGFRAWAVYGSWFYEDDYDYLFVARTADLDLNYLLRPHVGHVLPLTRLLAWGVSHSEGGLSWTLAATSTLALQAFASFAALWALLIIFGRRWLVLLPLSIFLFSALTLPVFMWWAAAMNQLGHLGGLWLAVAGWIQWERTRRHRWLVVPLVGLGISMFCDVRGLFIPPLLVMLSIAFFSSGNLLTRVTSFFDRAWLGIVLLAVPTAVYAIYYLTHATQIASAATLSLAGRLADTMLGTALPSGLVGGPLRWDVDSAPSAFAAPPDWFAHLAWIVIALFIAHAALTRTRVWLPIVVAVVYALALYGLLLTSRAPEVGAIGGFQYRYLTDMAAVGALAVGLMMMRLPGSADSTTERAHPLVIVNLRRWATPLALTITVSSIVSSLGYVSLWHHEHPGKDYVNTLSRSLRQVGPVDLVESTVPESTVSSYVWPDSRLRKLTSMLGADADFPDATDRLGIVTSNGTIMAAWVNEGLASKPGPVRGCGWKLTSARQRVPLEGRALRYPLWMRIGYLSSSDMDITVTAGDTQVQTRVKSGLNNLYVKTMGDFDRVRISGISADEVVCVDSIVVGEAIAGGSLT